MYHPKTMEFDSRLKKLFDEVDNYLEDLYESAYRLNKVRPARGETSNPEADGLFDIGAVFTPGYGSELGRGYLIDLKISTPEKIEENIRQEIYKNAADKVRELLPLHFPERELTVSLDRNHYKILGDFNLGEI